MWQQALLDFHRQFDFLLQSLPGQEPHLGLAQFTGPFLWPVIGEIARDGFRYLLPTSLTLLRVFWCYLWKS